MILTATMWGDVAKDFLIGTPIVSVGLVVSIFLLFYSSDVYHLLFHRKKYMWYRRFIKLGERNAPLEKIHTKKFRDATIIYLAWEKLPDAVVCAVMCGKNSYSSIYTRARDFIGNGEILGRLIVSSFECPRSSRRLTKIAERVALDAMKKNHKVMLEEGGVW